MARQLQWALLKNRRVDRQVEALPDDFAVLDDFSLPDVDTISIL